MVIPLPSDAELKLAFFLAIDVLFSLFCCCTLCKALLYVIEFRIPSQPSSFNVNSEKIWRPKKKNKPGRFHHCHVQATFYGW